jgi:uncharacterized protein (DUF169 family)
MPVGISLLNEEDLDFSIIKCKTKPMTVCQQISYARMYGWSSVVSAKESTCVLGANVTGLVEPPERVMDGSVNNGVYQKDEKAAQKMQKMMPRVKYGTKYVVAFPLSRPVEGIEPQSIVIYLNSGQAMRMIQSFLWKEGGEFVMKSSGDAGVCSRGVAQVINEQKPTIEIPCLGDRRFAMAQDTEVIAAFPYSMADEVTEGLMSTHKAGIRYPIPYQMPYEPQLPETYQTWSADLPD